MLTEHPLFSCLNFTFHEPKQANVNEEKGWLKTAQNYVPYHQYTNQEQLKLGGKNFYDFFVMPCIGTHRWNQVNLVCFKVSVKIESSILPYLSLSPTVHRNTPPKATSSPKMTAEKQEYNTVSTVSAQVRKSEKYWKLLRLSHFECFRFQ